MSALGGLGMDADAGGSSMLPSAQPVEVGKLSSLPVDPVASYVSSPVSPYPTIVDPFKRRTALREYFRGIRGENKENERVNEADMMKSPPTSLPKQKTLGLCRRHVVSATVAVSSEGKMRDKRKFNAPRQTPEKRQRPVESDFEAELPRRLDVMNQMVVEDVRQNDVSQFVSEEHVELDDQVLIRAEAEVQASQLLYARAKDIASSSSIHRQAQQDSPSLSFKPQTPTIRKPLTPVNTNRQQASKVHTSPMPWQPNFAAVVEREDNVSGESLFQLASGKRYQPSAAAKARAASLFESDADLADLPSFD